MECCWIAAGERRSPHRSCGKRESGKPEQSRDYGTTEGTTTKIAIGVGRTDRIGHRCPVLLDTAPVVLLGVLGFGVFAGYLDYILRPALAVQRQSGGVAQA
ncbi:MAG: mercury resistance system transport protein MerF, partial [Nitrospiraceae bacterium]